VHRAVRSTATVRNANRIGRRMAGGRANVNGFLLGRNNGEGQEVKDAIEVHLRHAHEGQQKPDQATAWALATAIPAPGCRCQGVL
jgi:hypothetical protein